MMEGESWVFRVKAESGESLGHYLGRFRRANNLSHKALAEHLGVRVEWVQAWESPSRRRNPTELQLMALSKLVEVDPKELALMLPPTHLHLSTRLCGECYAETPVHQAVWQRVGKESCDRHALMLLSACPVCGTGFRLPALWFDGQCESCDLPFSQMQLYQQASRRIAKHTFNR
jgi:transcriptional regulator with XRE-family HTH domain